MRDWMGWVGMGISYFMGEEGGDFVSSEEIDVRADLGHGRCG